MSNISLAIVDDEVLIVSLLRDFFKEQSGIELCFTATSGDECLEAIEDKQLIPDILILDLKMKGKSGVDILEAIKVSYPSIKTIVMSSHYKKSFIGFMLKTGVSAFIPKGVSPVEFLGIVKEVHQKGFFFEPEQLEVLREQVSSRVPKPVLSEKNVLSDREIEILKLICNQKTAKEIGDELFITQRTVEGHKNNLFIKTETKNVAGLVIYAIQNNLVNTDEICLI